jgi:hypothetical protein
MRDGSKYCYLYIQAQALPSISNVTAAIQLRQVHFRQADGRTDGWKDGRTDGRTDGWMDRRMDGMTDTWTDRHIRRDGQTSR